MSSNFILMTIVALVSIGLYYNEATSKQPVKYYDGEGNIIPEYAVQYLVKSEFVSMTKQEQDTLKKYFLR